MIIVLSGKNVFPSAAKNYLFYIYLYFFVKIFYTLYQTSPSLPPDGPDVDIVTLSSW